MTTRVTLDKVKIELSVGQIISAFRQLPHSEQEQVRRELGHEEWEARFRDLLARIWTRLESQPISGEAIDEEVRIVRDLRRAT